jgi:integrase
MTFKVARLTPTPKWATEERKLLEEIGESAVLPGLLYIINDSTQEIFEPAWLYLKAKFGGSLSPDDGNSEDISRHSNRAVAYNLAAWLNFLAAVKTHWSRVGHHTMLEYALFQSGRRSAHTGRVREPDTIKIKFSAITGFYNYTNAIGLTQVSWDRDTIRAAIGQGRRRRVREDERIRPFSPAALKRMRAALGAKPSELNLGKNPPTRDRLLLEVGLRTGMRGAEICHLRLKQILSTRPDLQNSDALVPIRITFTKGGRPRTVMFPNDLLHELQLYARGERKEAVAKLPKDHGYLFVNSANSGRPGQQLKTNTIHRRFSTLMRTLKMCEQATVVKAGVEVEVSQNLHSFHDTRHTFAVTKYIALKTQQRLNPNAFSHVNPWEIVQWALGHQDWDTTRKVYLRHVGEFEALIGSRVSEFLGA